MKNKLDCILIFIGCGFITAAFILFLHNQLLQQRAVDASTKALVRVVASIQKNQQKNMEQDSSGETVMFEIPPDLQDLMNSAASVNTGDYEEDTGSSALSAQSPVVNINGYDYVGILTIKPLGLELPAMNDWTYEQLRMGICRYSGSIDSGDLVIMGHNYARHFAKLKDIRIGDVITFTDMNRNTFEYEVSALDILGATDVEEMTSGEYALSLFTCNYAGDKRIMIRCDYLKD